MSRSNGGASPVANTSVSTGVPGTSPNPAYLLPRCNCRLGTMQITSLCKSHCQISSGADRLPDTILSDTLNTMRSLVEHWADLNVCACAEVHMDVEVLRSMTDAVRQVLSGHEVVVRAVTRCLRSGGPGAAGGGGGGHGQAAEWGLPKITIGNEELRPEEVAIVVQEALTHSLVHLGTMLHDIQDEAALHQYSPAACQLRERDIKELITQFLRLLGNVKDLETV